VYFLYIKNYDLAKKYYLGAIDKGSVNAMDNLGNYYEFTEKNYDLAKKYYKMAADKEDVFAMFWLGFYYYSIEKNDDLTTKYFSMAADNGDHYAMCYLAVYYQRKKKYDLTEKYYLMAISKGNKGRSAAYSLGRYYINNKLYDKNLQNYLFAIIKGNIRFKYIGMFNNNNVNDIWYYKIIDLFCSIFKKNYINNLHLEDFNFCLLKIVNCIHNNLYNRESECYKLKTELKNIKYFAEYVGVIYYYHNGKTENKNDKNNKNDINDKSDKNDKTENKKKREIIKKIIKNNGSQLLIEYLDLCYFRYLEKIYMPGGKEYIKTKNHFELIANSGKYKI
jgi:TPR repeat protein